MFPVAVPFHLIIHKNSINPALKCTELSAVHISSQPAEKTTDRTAGTQFPDIRPTPNPNHMSHLGDSVLNYDFYLARNMTREHEDYFICECKLPNCYVFGVLRHTEWVQELMSFKIKVVSLS